MLKNDAHMADRMTEVLDNAPVAIMVRALDDWTILYANRPARELDAARTGGGSKACYQAVGYDRPCPACAAEQLRRDALHVREWTATDSGRTYQLSGKLIDWAGRPAHIEYILDITERKKEERQDQQLKEELIATFSGVPCGLSVYRVVGDEIVPLFHNTAFCDIMGYSEENIRNIEKKTEFLGVHPDDLAPLRQKIGETVHQNGTMQHIYRVWNDRRGEYRSIKLEGAVTVLADGVKMLYGVYSDVSEWRKLEHELTAANDTMQDIINAIPGGVALYRVTDRFETVYFSDGVPALTGYTVEEYHELVKRDAAEMIYAEDAAMVVENARRVIEDHMVADFEFRKQHRDGHIVWVHVQVKQTGEQDGAPLLQCVFHNISKLKETQLELDHMVNSIPGGIASYRVEGNRFIPTFFSDGVMALSGHTRAEYNAMAGADAMNAIYPPDRPRVLAAARAAVESGAVLDVSYRMRHKDGHLIWIHLNGRRMGPLAGAARFYAVFTGMSAETRLFQSITDETADSIYIIDKENYELLYANDTNANADSSQQCVGQKCYEALAGKHEPCAFCTLGTHLPNGQEHVMEVDGTDRVYTTRFRETNWNGIPAYIKYVRDVTEEVRTRQEKERLAMYFETVVKNLPGGISVVRCKPDGGMTPEFISDGLAEMLHMTAEQAAAMYEWRSFVSVHPDDAPGAREQLAHYMQSGAGHCELTLRLRQADGGYIWVKDAVSLLETSDGTRRLYSVYTDVTKSVEEKEQLRRQYEDVLLQHYRLSGPDELILGHCNITQNRILEIIDHTGSDLLETFGTVRETFFAGIASLVVEPVKRQEFLDTYLNAPAIAAFRRNETEQVLKCFIKLPREPQGRYVQFKVNLVETPDTGDLTGVLTVTDITEQTVSDLILHQLSVTSYDYVVDLDLTQDAYAVLARNEHACRIPPPRGCYSARVAEMARDAIVPKDRVQYAAALQPAEIRRRLEREGSYTFSYSLLGENGETRSKNMTVSAIDLRIGRACLVCADITDSVREQRGLLNMMAYTFELMGFIHLASGRFTMYTRDTVLENLPPYVVEHYDAAVGRFATQYGTETDEQASCLQFQIGTILGRLAEKPSGYDFVFPYQSGEGQRYKQINVLWGDESHSTVCVVRADVTEMLAAERESKQALEKALYLAEEANRAKSDFLSAMSHDIRTPMNAIMGMTALAVAHIGEPVRVADCLQKISISSKHLLSLINDVLDMSKIEQNKITLNRMVVSLPELIAQLSAIMAPQAEAAGLRFGISTQGVSHEAFYGDALRINQVLINILSNAVKFTPAGGSVECTVEEIPPTRQKDWARYRFTVRDTGIGMSEEFLSHVFAPFARNRNAAYIEGTGLGLSITKGLVDLMGGEIAVESRNGEGTVIRVELEYETAQAETRLPAGGIEHGMTMDATLEGRVFLVAEDNALNAEILCELLAMHGAKAVVRTDGEQAVHAFRDAPPGAYDAILMDVQMPVMNGYEATRAIRALQRADAASIPIVAMTANAFAEDIQAAQDAGMTAHVAKPIDVELLYVTLGKVLGL